MSAVPSRKSWERRRLRDAVTKLVDGSHNPPPKQDVGRPMLSARNVEQGRIVFGEYRFISDESFAAEDARTRVAPGDVLLTIVGTIGRSAVVPDGIGPLALQRSVAVLTPKPELLPRFLSYQLQSPRIQRHFEDHARGTAQKGVYLKTLGETPLLLPQLDEQREIVAEIEKQFSRLDEAVANLLRVKANLKRYKAAVLTAAVSGDLVEIEAKRSMTTVEPPVSGVRIGQGRKPSSRRGREAGSLDPLPEGWIWAEAADLASPEPNSICAGPFGTIFKAKDFRPAGVPIIFLRHVAPLRYLDRKPGFMDPGKWEELFKPYSAYGGELLITKLGEPPGVCAMYPRGIGPAMVTPDVIKMNVDPNVASSTYVMYYFNSETAKRFATGAAFGTTRTRLTLPLFREMPVALPPLAEQHRIVAEVDRRLSIAREVETEVDANLKRAAALRAAVLDRAFAPGCPDSYSKD